MNFSFVAIILSFAHEAIAANLFGRDRAKTNGLFGPVASWDKPGKKGPVKCILQLVEPYMLNGTHEEQSVKVCEMHPDYEDGGIPGIIYDFDSSTLPQEFFDHVEFSKTEVTISSATRFSKGKNGGGTLKVDAGAIITKEKKDKPEKPENDKPDNGKPDNGNPNNGNPNNGKPDKASHGNSLHHLRGGVNRRSARRLAQKTGFSTLIVLYAVPLDAKNDHRTSTQMANEVFGISAGEPKFPNALTQMRACSGGKLMYLPACGTDDQECFGNPLVVNGVMEVPIEYNVIGEPSGTVHNWVNAAATRMLSEKGIDLSTFDQIMQVLPSEVDFGPAAAWAYMPGTTSVFMDSYSSYLNIQMHEYGHNLGLDHSGSSSGGYGDATCYMGISPDASCFNGAKSFELGWYSEESDQVDPFAGVYQADLIGVADWSAGRYDSAKHKIILQIQDETEALGHMYIIYNRNKEITKGGTMYRDSVTVTLDGGFTTSQILAGLASPRPEENLYPLFRKPNFRNTGKDLVVKVCATSLPPPPRNCQDIFDPSSKLVTYNEDGSCGPRGDDAQVDGSECPHGVTRICNFNEQFYGGFTLNGCKYFAFDVYKCAEGEATADTVSVLVYLDDGPGFNNGQMCDGEVGCLSDSDCEDGNWCTVNACDLNTNTCIPPLDVSAQKCPACGDVTFCNPNGTCDPVCDDGNKCTTDSCSGDTCRNIPNDIFGCALPGSILETWFDIAGTLVSDMTGSDKYTNDFPDETEILMDGLKVQSYRGEYFGSRLRTFILAPADGVYTFYIASDDSSELWLSRDSYPENKAMIASVQSYTDDEAWDQYPSQKSSPITLVSGHYYYLEVLYKEGSGRDHLSIAWESDDAGLPRAVIGGDFTFQQPKGIILETWLDIYGTSVEDLTRSDGFKRGIPDTEIEILLDGFKAPSYRGDNFGSRFRAYLLVPATGTYNFYISSDDSSELWLSQDDDPVNKVMISSVPDFTGEEVWDKYSSQKSSPVALVSGRYYFLEALHKEAGGGDNLAVAWESVDAGLPLGVISQEYLYQQPSLYSPMNQPAPTDQPSRSPVGAAPSVLARKVRIQLKGYTALTLVEVEAIDDDGTNRALNRPASQSSNYYDSSLLASNAVNGLYQVNGNHEFSSTSYEQGAWWQVDLGEDVALTEVIVTNRVDCCMERLSNSVVSLLDANNNVVKAFEISDTSNVAKINVAASLFSDTIPGAILETWLNVGGTAVGSLTGSAGYINGIADEMDFLLGGLKAPSNRGTDFGSRLRTFIKPPTTGMYTFYVASDDNSQLWLSENVDPTNEVDDPTGKVLIASVPGYTGEEAWGTYPEQKSRPIALVAGQYYYLEALHKEGGGSDNLAVAWESADAGISLAVIGEEYAFQRPPGPLPSPTPRPTSGPTTSPTNDPTSSPSDRPTDAPTGSPTDRPTDTPSLAPSQCFATNAEERKLIDDGLRRLLEEKKLLNEMDLEMDDVDEQIRRLQRKRDALNEELDL